MKSTDIEEIKSEIDGLIVGDIEDLGKLASQLHESQTKEAAISIKHRLLSKKASLYAHKYHYSDDAEQELTKQEIVNLNSVLVEAYTYHEERLKAVQSQCSDLIALADSLIQGSELDEGIEDTKIKSIDDIHLLNSDKDAITTEIKNLVRNQKGIRLAKIMAALFISGIIRIPEKHEGGLESLHQLLVNDFGAARCKPTGFRDAIRITEIKRGKNPFEGDKEFEDIIKHFKK